MATKTKKATTGVKLQCFTSKKAAQAAAKLARKITGRKTIKAEGTCVVSTSAVSGTRKRKRKTSTARKVTRRRTTR